YALRQLCQGLCAFAPPEGMIWRSPGFPSLLVTYGTATDLFFSGHTAIAVYGGPRAGAFGRRVVRAAWGVHRAIRGRRRARAARTLHGGRVRGDRDRAVGRRRGGRIWARGGPRARRAADQFLISDVAVRTGFGLIFRLETHQGAWWRCTRTC